MNLNEITFPPDADEAMEWACLREFALRYDSYGESLVRAVGLTEAIAAYTFCCTNGVGAQEWVHSVRAELLA